MARISVRSRGSEWEGARRAPVWLVVLLGLVLAGSAMVGLHSAAGRLATAREAEAYAAQLNLLVTSTRAAAAPGSGPVPGSQLQAAQSLLALEPAVIALQQQGGGSAATDVRAAFDAVKTAASDAQGAILTGQGQPAELDALVGASADAFVASAAAARDTLHRDAVQAERWFILFAAGVFAATGAAVAGLALMIGRQRSAASNARFREQGRFRAMTAMSNDLMALVDRDGEVRVQSASILRLLGRSDLWMTGRAFADIVHPEDRVALGTLLSSAGAGDGEPLTLRLSHGDGSWRAFHVVATAVAPAEGEAEVVLLTGREQAPATVARPEALPAPAFTHPVSGLLTEAIFMDRLQHALVRAARGASPVGLLAIDLGADERFAGLKPEARSAALRSIGGRLSRAVRSSDSIGHVGAQDLVILLDDTDEIVARGVAKRIVEQLQVPVSLLDAQLTLAPRVGIAVKTDPRQTADQLLAAAQVALTEHPVVNGPAHAGERAELAVTDTLTLPTEPAGSWAAAAMGRGLLAARSAEPAAPLVALAPAAEPAPEAAAEPLAAVAVAVAVATAVLDQPEAPAIETESAPVVEAAAPVAVLPAPVEEATAAMPAAVEVEVASAPVQAMAPALDPSELDIQYIPALALETGEIIELEAVVRWRHPQRGAIALDLAGKSIAAAALPIVLEQACRVATAIPATRTGAAVRMSVNLPVSAPLNDELVDLVAETLLTSGLAPAGLQLEVAARALDPEPARREADGRVLAQLRALGVRIAIDGVGTEADRLAEFLTLPISGVKIDRAVVSLLDRSADRRATVRTVVELAKPHGISVNGVGVETLDQAERLWDLGADEGQGPLFFRPVTEEQLQALFTGDALVAAD